MAGHTPDGSSEKDESHFGHSEPTAEPAEWFYTQRGETYGPVSVTELLAAAHLGFLRPDDLVCRKDRGKWVAARSVHGLFKEAG